MRPLTRIWTGCALCLVGMVALMAWVTVRTLALEDSEWVSAIQSENERLALWRMDSALVALIAEESSRPFESYNAFYPVTNAYSDLLRPLPGSRIQQPSPLLINEQPYVQLHFQCAPSGEFTSPQVPTSNLRDIAEQSLTTTEQILSAERSLRTLCESLSRQELETLIKTRRDQPRGSAQATRRAVIDVEQDVSLEISRDPQQQQQQQQRSIAEYKIRNRNLLLGNTIVDSSRNGGNTGVSSRSFRSIDGPKPDVPKSSQPSPSGAPPTDLSPMQAFFRDDQLLLARTAEAEEGEVIQGCLLNWPEIQVWLLSQIEDILPDARLKPLSLDDPQASPLRLASIPVLLVPGRSARPERPVWSPIRTALATAWAWLAISSLAVFGLVLGLMRLSERRAAFVSAVTHELRTPLTTFRLYTDLLEQGHQLDEEKQSRYIHTLKQESERLAHLVENVLAYSRLERKPARDLQTGVRLSDLLEQICPVLERLADQSKIAFACRLPDNEPVDQVLVQADLQAVERILHNLYDNAGKYGTTAERREVELVVRSIPGWIELCVRDFGTGIPDDMRRKLFEAFCKSDSQAARSAPGVGLGLSLSRRLALSLGGELVSEAVSPGACFVLRLRRLES